MEPGSLRRLYGLRQLFKVAPTTLERSPHLTFRTKAFCVDGFDSLARLRNQGTYMQRAFLYAWVSSDQQQALNRDTSRHAISPYGENHIHGFCTLATSHRVRAPDPK
jgi:hypothetical protein